jgi:peptidoglycan/xylan/chitin deacetylase (PgdA/CDA1 family)
MLKKFLILFLASFLFFLITGTVNAQATNLVLNSSVEVPSGDQTLPEYWQRDSWGTNNATFTYSNEGYDGNRSVNISITSYQSGDAKWAFRHASVVPNQSYTYYDYYKASVASYLVAQVKDNAGNISYNYLRYVAPAPTWQSVNVSFTAPANASTVTIFHLINSIGSLQIDSAVLSQIGSEPTLTPSLTPTATPTAAPTATLTPTPSISATPSPTPNANLVFNESLESVNSLNQPIGWANNKWGSNEANFSVLSTGYTGSKSIRTDVTSYQSGDAKWYPTHVSVTPGKTYQFSDYYLSNTTTGVLVQYGLQDNSFSYFWLGSAPTASSWTKFQNHFTVPANVRTLTVFHLISGVGYLTVDDYLLKEFTPEGFSRALISLTFDDATESQYRNGAPLLAKYSFFATFYLTTGYINTSGYMTRTQVNGLKNAGHQLAAHTINHPNLTTLSTTELTNQLTRPITDIKNWFGIDTLDFCSPFGAYNTDTLNAIRQYYRSHRSANSGLNYRNDFDIYKIKVRNVLRNTPNSTIQAWVDEAKEKKAWLVLVYHPIDTGTDPYGATPQNLDAQLSMIKNSGVTVKTLNDALVEISPQLN